MAVVVDRARDGSRWHLRTGESPHRCALVDKVDNAFSLLVIGGTERYPEIVEACDRHHAAEMLDLVPDRDASALGVQEGVVRLHCYREGVGFSTVMNTGSAAIQLNAPRTRMIAVSALRRLCVVSFLRPSFSAAHGTLYQLIPIPHCLITGSRPVLHSCIIAN